MKIVAKKTERMKSLNGETRAVWVSEFGLEGGIDMRDYFAAKAMQSLLIADGTTRFEQRAKEAYAVADAMLAERNKGEEE